MSYTKLGNSGLIVSRLALGTMTFTEGGEFIPGIAKTGQEAATEMVHAALDAGVNFFDSADGYSSGDAERMLGIALKGRREDAVICTKVGFRRSPRMTDAGLSRQHLTRSVEDCLTRLGTDHLDLLVVHKNDFTTPMEETITALDDLVRAGKVRYIGCSNWPAWELARAVQAQRDNGLAQFIAGQYLYNAVARDIELDVLRVGQAMGVGLMAWSPLSGGLLTGKYDPAAMDEAKDGRLSESDFLSVPVATAQAAIASLTDIAAAHEAKPAEVALAWILHKRRNHTVVIGASRLSQLESSLSAAALSLSEEEMARLDDVAPPPRRYPEWFADGLTDETHREALA